PIHRLFICEHFFHHHAAETVTQQATKALTAQRDQALRRVAHVHGRFFIHVDVRGDVIEVIAYAVQQNAEEQQGVGEVLLGAAVNKETVANGGGDQAQQQDLLNTKAFGKEWQSEHEE